MSEDFEELYITGLYAHALLRQVPVRVLPDGRSLHLEGLMGGRARLHLSPVADDHRGFDDTW